MVVQKAAFVFNQVETVASLNGGPPRSYLEQQTEVDKPLLEVNWIGFFNHFAHRFL